MWLIAYFEVLESRNIEDASNVVSGSAKLKCS